MKDLEKILNDIKLEMSLSMSAAEYMLWVDGLTPVADNGNQIIVCAPSDNARNTLEDSYAFKFLDACASSNHPYSNVIFITEEEKHLFTDESAPIPKETEIKLEEKKKPNPFIELYTFDNFVVGDSNKLAFTTARTVAENPGINDGLLNLNPLYIYGGVGLGKTHLLHSIGNYIINNNPSLNVIYVPTERLSNEYFASLSKYSTDKDSYRNFREKYSSADVLILDDVQFLQKKGGLQDVIFHIFNDLYNQGKQIILASDRPPKDINDIEDRLRSRFEGGLMADIWTPNLDTRVSIILKKLEKTQINLDDEVIYYLAEKINTNIRELEGALSRVIMFSQLNGNKPTLELAKEALKENDDLKSDVIDSKKIISAVSEYFNIPESDIIGKKKTKEIVEARMMAIYLTYDILSLPLINIGQVFGGRDHTTIIYSRDKIINALNNDGGKTERIVKDIKSVLNVE